MRPVLRKTWLFYSDKRKQTLLSGRIATLKGRQKYLYQCAKCHWMFKAKEIKVDHVEELGHLDLSTPMKVGQWIFNLFFGPMQLLCETCHQEKTNKARRAKNV